MDALGVQPLAFKIGIHSAKIEKRYPFILSSRW